MARESQKLTSLDVVRSELDSLLEQQERRGVSFDNRAGMVLGFGGVLISLSGTQPTALQLPTSKLAILDTRIDIFERDETRLESKISQLTWAVYALGSSVLLLLFIAIVEFLR